MSFEISKIDDSSLLNINEIKLFTYLLAFIHMNSVERFSPKGGGISNKSWAYQSEENKRMYDVRTNWSCTI